MTAHRDTGILRRFLRQCTRRLWLAEFYQSANQGLWSAAIALLTLGIAHALVVDVSPAVVVTVIATIALLVAIRTGMRRPAPVTAARIIDRRLHAGSLLVTAAETIDTEHSSRRAGVDIVIEKAASAVPDWRSRLRFATRPEWRLAPAGALLPLFAGLVLLAQPAARGPAPAIVTSIQDAAKMPDGRAPIDRLKDEIRRSKSMSGTGASDPGDVGRGESSRVAVPPDESSARETDARAPGVTAAVSRPAADRGAAAGDAARVAGAPDSLAAAALPVARAFDVSVSGAIATTAAADGRYDVASHGPDSRTSQTPAALPPELGSANDGLSPALAAYASRYLGASDEMND